MTNAQTQPNDVKVSFFVDSTTEDEFNAHIILTNNRSEVIKNWVLGFTFQRLITSLSNAKLIQEVGDYYLISGTDANKDIPPHESVSFSFKGKYTIRNLNDGPSGYFILSNEDKIPVPIQSEMNLIPWQSNELIPGKDDYVINLNKSKASIEGNSIDQNKNRLTTIIPMPVYIKHSSGEFLLNANTAIIVDTKNTELTKLAAYLIKIINKPTGYTLPILNKSKTKEGIFLNLINDKEIGDEGYTLDISSNAIRMNANTATGLFYAIQTLRQLLPPQFFGETKITKPWGITNIYIKDYPRFAYRGVLLDVARHFFSINEVKRFIDLMAMHKLNVLHWHLTDDEGWRIEIKKYPQLTNIGAWRGYNEVLPPALGSGIKRYGGFYTKDEIKDVIKYATDRFITIIPEIDIPGHSRALIQSLPELIDTKDKTIYKSVRGFSDNVLSPCIDSTYLILENIFNEVVSLFPSHYIHIGSDERAKGSWLNSQYCNATMEKNNLKNTDELQLFFMKTIQKILAVDNRAIGAWEEILEGGDLSPTPRPLIYSWISTDAGILAAKKGYDVIMSPSPFLYLELAYSVAIDEPGDYWGGYVDTFKVYSYSPIPNDLSDTVASNIKGVEGALWSEYIYSNDLLDYFAFPKLVALSEVAWTKKSLRHWQNFTNRLVQYHLPRLFYYGVKYRLSPPGVQYLSGQLQINNEFPGLIMRYTLDGSAPSPASPQYKIPLQTDANVIKVQAFDLNGNTSRMIEVKK